MSYLEVRCCREFIAESTQKACSVASYVKNRRARSMKFMYDVFTPSDNNLQCVRRWLYRIPTCKQGVCGSLRWMRDIVDIV